MLQTDVAANTRCHPLPLAVSCCLATSTTRPSLLPTTIPKVTTFGIHKGGKARVDVSELSRVAMERCKTARCAIGLMGSLAEEYGYYGADETEGEGGESLQIVEILKSAGKIIEYVEYPDEGHGIVRPENRLDFYSKAERFLAKHLGGRYEE